MLSSAQPTRCHKENPKGELCVGRHLYLQFALLVQVKDAFFEVVHLAEHQSLVEHGVITPQQQHSLLLQDLFPLQTYAITKK